MVEEGHIALERLKLIEKAVIMAAPIAWKKATSRLSD